MMTIKSATQDNAMEAGIELDHLIAEKVMGWNYYEKKCFKDPEMILGYWDKGDKFPHWSGEGNEAEAAWLFKPSTDIGIAWEVMDKIKDIGEDGLDLKYYKPECEWCCGPVELGFGGREMDCFGKSKSAPHAICLAALKAVGHYVN